MRGLFFLVAFAGCGTTFSGFREYCVEQTDCLDGNDADEKACMLQIQNDRRVARAYGCHLDYNEYMMCLKEEAECESDYDIWHDDGDCSDEQEDLFDCLADESEYIEESQSYESESYDEEYEIYDESDEAVAD